MHKNLLVGCVGPTSLHKEWICGDLNFDLMLVDYGDNEQYRQDAQYYLKAKGTKFNIIGSIFDEIPKEYDYVFIPDDDLYMNGITISRLFDIAAQYGLKICQPSLLGYYSIYVNLHNPASVLRYTNYIEIIGPCFSRDTFELCRPTFSYNKSCWGIEMLWDKLLGFPQDQEAVVDDVIAIHTRPCFWGDYYSNNGVDSPYVEAKKLVEENGLSWEKKVYGKIEKIMGEADFAAPSETRIYPNVPGMPELCKSLSRKIYMM